MTSCLKCNGLMTYSAEYYDSPASWFCLNCGMRVYGPMATPVEPDQNRTWDAEVCMICMKGAAVRGFCRACRATDSLIVHKRAIKQKWEARR